MRKQLRPMGRRASEHPAEAAAWVMTALPLGLGSAAWPQSNLQSQSWAGGHCHRHSPGASAGPGPNRASLPPGATAWPTTPRLETRQEMRRASAHPPSRPHSTVCLHSSPRNTCWMPMPQGSAWYWQVLRLSPRPAVTTSGDFQQQVTLVS